MPREDLVKNLKDESFYETFARAVSCWEDRKNANPKAREPRVPKGKTVVQARQTDMLQTSEVMGFLWPVKMYKKHFGKPPPRSKLIIIPHQGKQVTGILLDESQGKPIGVIAVNSISQAAAEKVGVVADSTEVVSDTELDSAWQNASKRVRVNVKENTKDGKTFAKVTLADTRGEDSCSSEGDITMLDSIWGGRIAAKRGGKRCRNKGNKGEDDSEDDDDDLGPEEKKPKKAKRAPSSSASVGGGGGGSVGGGGGGSASSGQGLPLSLALPAGTPPPAKKVTKEIENSEQTRLSAQQFLSNMASDQ
eukprot:1399243-Lingulodinium_polyedra.AAC.1